jgi:hypothetical protein
MTKREKRYHKILKNRKLIGFKSFSIEKKSSYITGEEYFGMLMPLSSINNNWETLEQVTARGIFIKNLCLNWV